MDQQTLAIFRATAHSAAVVARPLAFSRSYWSLKTVSLARRLAEAHRNSSRRSSASPCLVRPRSPFLGSAHETEKIGFFRTFGEKNALSLHMHSSVCQRA